MTRAATFTRTSAQTLRDEFDRSFSLAMAALAPQQDTLLAVRLAGAPYALRMEEIAGLFVDRLFVPMPSPLPELLGLTAFRGEAMPVYDLGGLLGLRSVLPLRWLVLTRVQPRVALAFECFETRIAYPAGGKADEVALEGEAPRPVVALGRLIDGIRRREEALRESKEGLG